MSDNGGSTDEVTSATGGTPQSMPKLSSVQGLAAALGLALVFGATIAITVHFLRGGSPCSDDWRKCSDNQQLVRDSGLWELIGSDCQLHAEHSASGAALIWPWATFGTFRPGNSYITTGVAVAIEPDAQSRNTFGALVRSTVICSYDLHTNRVIWVDIVPERAPLLEAPLYMSPIPG